MNVTLQEATPFDQSVVWRIHDAYFAARGIDAWNTGEVPFYATSSFVSASQHARFFAAYVAERLADGRIGADEEIWVLEVGSGLGWFATNFFRALMKGAGPLGEQLLHRVRYVLSDYSAKSLGEAVATPVLARLVAEGSVVPALYDLRRPETLRTLSGAPFDCPRPQWIVANYVSCVLPVKTFQWRRDGGFHEQHVVVRAEIPDDSAVTAPGEVLDALLADATRSKLLEETIGMDVIWRPVDLAEVYPSGRHAEVLRRFAEELPDATFSYPHGFFDFLDTAAGLLAPGGMVLVNDYGSVELASIRGRFERKPQIYGNSIAVAIHFPLLAAWAEGSGWHALATADVLASIHSCALRPGADFGDAERAAFDAAYVSFRGTDDMLDWASAGAMALEAKEHDRAVRFYRRCLQLEPDSVEFHHRLGTAAIEGRRYDVALKYLARGLELAGPDQTTWDLEFQLGRAHCLVEDYAEAAGWYEKALEKERHPTTLVNLGVVYQELGRGDDAFRCFQSALTMDRRDLRARAALLRLRDRWWLERLRGVVGPDAEDFLAEEPA